MCRPCAAARLRDSGNLLGIVPAVETAGCDMSALRACSVGTQVSRPRNGRESFGKLRTGSGALGEGVGIVSCAVPAPPRRSGTRGIYWASFPPLKRRAVICRPSGPGVQSNTNIDNSTIANGRQWPTLRASVRVAVGETANSSVCLPG